MSGINDKIGDILLKAKLKEQSRNKEVSNIEAANKIGILFNATHEFAFRIIKDFVKTLNKNGKQVTVLGFVNSKKVIDHYLYRKGFLFFTKNQLTWYKHPKEEGVKKFIRTEFDILINLNLEDCLPIRYIVGLSKAKFKVGNLNTYHEYHDMMIDIEKERMLRQEIKKEVSGEIPIKQNSQYESIVEEKADEEFDLNFLIEQSYHYLSIIDKNFVNLSVEK